MIADHRASGPSGWAVVTLLILGSGCTVAESFEPECVVAQFSGDRVLTAADMRRVRFETEPPRSRLQAERLLIERATLLLSSGQPLARLFEANHRAIREDLLHGAGRNGKPRDVARRAAAEIDRLRQQLGYRAGPCAQGEP